MTASDLENYGEAAWWSGKLEEAISLRERAHSAYTAAGDLLGAALMALRRDVRSSVLQTAMPRPTIPGPLGRAEGGRSFGPWSQWLSTREDVLS